MKRRKKKRNLKFKSRNNRYEKTMKLYHYTSISAFESIIKSDFWRFSSLEFANDKRERYADLNDDSFSKCHYLCTSEDNNNPVLWYHYTNKYNGVCLKLDLKDDDFDFIRIKYDHHSIRKNIKVPENKAKEYLSHKSKHWAYENEIRAFYKGEPDELDGMLGIKNAKDLIKNIVIGNDVKYDTLTKETISYLKTFLNAKKLYGIFWEDGEGKTININPPELLDAIKKQTIIFYP